jgi:hypothetical protein
MAGKITLVVDLLFPFFFVERYRLVVDRKPWAKVALGSNDFHLRHLAVPFEIVCQT